MISVGEALDIVRQHTLSFGVEMVPLLQSVGRILVQDIKADRDFPPFNRATMDGIAISNQAFQAGTRSFIIESIQPAGHPQKQLNNPSHCIEIMTGAMLPFGTDAVIRYEDIVIDINVATVNINAVSPWQNVHLQATDEKVGEILVNSGLKITPAIVATMATVGLADVAVYRMPRIAVCSTGDELVPVNVQPLPHQIRQSNSYMLLAALQQAGINATACHLPDEPVAMEQQVQRMLQQYDVLLFSGAVSKGKFDYLPQVLQQLGMQTLFHSIAQKPGKPLLFGKFNAGPLVFGFPGNPVSTWVCYQLYFKAWLSGCLGVSVTVVAASLSKTTTFKPQLSCHLLVKLNYTNDAVFAEPVDTSTSGDMVNLIKANGFITLPANEDTFAAGRLFNVHLFD
ncbi:molybdopterin molybdotransferase MoeA [Mucilaginibacter aquatilis]|uniref:Molybdopterin molybdenumtransferase n=1 Tax=Mucilaginibacter aquatilis TaxID=1517760 RepID=A0A6I4IG13_9SPHI|nr:molybdopterin molybdotransferase MoeA [Mucilaginibacter aquatilis]MVN92299.1 molybdopterin molybdenumtransferase MoeA [Mucilaginibacter aquatilis]